jgi:hypothetical protein
MLRARKRNANSQTANYLTVGDNDQSIIKINNKTNIDLQEKVEEKNQENGLEEGVFMKPELVRQDLIQPEQEIIKEIKEIKEEKDVEDLVNIIEEKNQKLLQPIDEIVNQEGYVIKFDDTKQVCRIDKITSNGESFEGSFSIKDLVKCISGCDKFLEKTNNAIPMATISKFILDENNKLKTCVDSEFMGNISVLYSLIRELDKYVENKDIGLIKDIEQSKADKFKITVTIYEFILNLLNYMIELSIETNKLVQESFIVDKEIKSNNLSNLISMLFKMIEKYNNKKYNLLIEKNNKLEQELIKVNEQVKKLVDFTLKSYSSNSSAQISNNSKTSISKETSASDLKEIKSEDIMSISSSISKDTNNEVETSANSVNSVQGNEEDEYDNLTDSDIKLSPTETK